MNHEIRDTAAELARFRRRLLVIACVVLFGFALIGARLAVLQVVRHDDLAERAESNRTAIVPIVPNRGLILDRNGVVLASNYAAYTLEITPSKAGDVNAAIDELGDLVEVTPRDRRRFQRLREDSRSFDSIPIRTRLSDEEVARFAAHRYRFPGVEIKARLFRNYPHGETAAHVIGYIGRINQREKTAMDDWQEEDRANYRGTDYIGKLGIEQSYEKVLHGETGVEQMETSAGGRAVRRLARHPAVPGQTVMLSLDIKLQKLVEDMFGERRGALVAIDPKSGEVLAFVSKPTFDPNLFVEGIDVESWKALSESIDNPLLNRALRGTYPPGSTYKPFMALAALQTGKRAANVVENDPGYYNFGGRTFRSHRGGLGGVDMHRAIQYSSNTYFYSLATEMGVDLIHDFMAPLGFGQATGIDLIGEVRGVLPSTAWKRQAYRRAEMKKWHPGETISLGIGQGYNSFTMLQLASANATLANAGVRYQPHLVRAIRDTVSGEVVQQVQPPAQDLGYARRNVDVVRNAMVAVTQGGTGTRVFAGAAYASAGKTGTAQAVSLSPKARASGKALDARQRDHALYMAFAPAENPTIAVAAIVENAGFGAAHAAPIVRRVFDYWIAGQYPNDTDMAAVKTGTAGAPIGTPLVASEVPLAEDRAEAAADEEAAAL
ncbi:penicillin-binding protein 2 [Variovorax sp. OK605]|jgi:penicillin-binding protein 2|uniref:penicillin-binding protein 2 n=1 Tax=unclassified Variovorax TaxID=663243 RepID=UPI0008AF6E8F|nr:MULTISPECIES: penicillin-binding protein 2 [unclassified Variovorax]SEK15827.1 penicillin-binding protein 2 [Variovorax sp. OK202]SFE22053.1 penicillin-binding protein 2 [Variovorax sp. OK212]SFP89122.1 penicillin-binding protein 2 [Variovorax sp. OK605]